MNTKWHQNAHATIIPEAYNAYFCSSVGDLYGNDSLMDTLNYISVAESAQREISATGAKLAVRISGQSFFTGREAFKKASEVSECVAALASCGIIEKNIHIKNVSTQVESGFLTKSSSATYDLEVLCDSMELLGPAIASVSALKNSAIVSLTWVYADMEKTKRKILQSAVRSAYASANAIASTLDTSLLGVHRLKYDVSGLDDRVAMPQSSLSQLKRARTSEADFTGASGGLSLSHTTTISVHVFADFLIELL